ncbi:MAG: DUF1345 domain-containing protein [Pseudorhodobacter sp.]|nr:DUF1345 domain-containing protein [Rhizobacter sp.]
MNLITARPRLLASLAAGMAVTLAVPASNSWVTRALLGWNVGVVIYLALITTFMLKADHGKLKRVAAAHAEGAAVVLTVVVVAALTSLVAIVVELSAAKLPGSHHALPHVLLALSTVVCSWTLLPTLFTLNYASLYFTQPGGGLRFPDDHAGGPPDYADFAYFAFTIAVASQTADVSITTRPMRRLALAQSLLSFLFNTTILALMINITASLF